MPKITVAGGASNPDALPGETGYIAPQPAPEPEPEPEAAFEGEHGPELAPLPAPGTVLPQGWAPDPAPTADAPDYGSMTKGALVEEAKARALPVSGSKADLAARLADHDAQGAPPAGEG
jgi:hypothetical protein